MFLSSFSILACQIYCIVATSYVSSGAATKRVAMVTVLIDESRIYDGATATLAYIWMVLQSHHAIITWSHAQGEGFAVLGCAHARQYKHSQHGPTCKRTLTRSVSMI